MEIRPLNINQHQLIEDWLRQEYLKNFNFNINLKNANNFLIYKSGKAIACFQTIALSEFALNETAHPKSTTIFSFFIGEKSLIRTGLSHALINEITQYIFSTSSVQRIVCAPNEKNTLAKKALQKSGMNFIRNFQIHGISSAIFHVNRFPKLESERLIVRLAKLSDAESILALNKSNDENFFKPWNPELPYEYYELSFWQKAIASAMEQFIQDKSVRFVFHKKEDEKIIGTINFTNFERGPFQNCRLGYKIDQAHAKQGYMSEALSIAIEYIFEFHQLHRVEAAFIPNNLASQAVLKKQGFAFVGIAKNYLKIAGQWQDHMLTYKNNPNQSLFN